ncbi:MAG: DeoR family transcriptional regulator, partial [Monoglobaceae bacterium]
MSMFDRRMEILLMLKRCKSITRVQLASDFSVSDDTIGRDLIALSRYVPICSKLGRYGHIYLLDKPYKYNTYLSDNEITVLKKMMDISSEEDR